MKQITDCKRIVIKIGTSTLTHQTGRINIRRFEHLCRVLADVKNMGKEIILVSSGAVGVGVGKLGLSSRPSDMPGKQAAAAVGQCELMHLYDQAFLDKSHNVAQVLLTRDVIEDPERHLNAHNTFQRLLEMGAIPIVNENDTVAVDELVVGDNDTLSAMVSLLCDADLLIILSDIDGLYEADPHTHPDAPLISRVDTIDSRIESIAGGSRSGLGTGGMRTKIDAAKMVTADGIAMAIVNGSNPDVLYDLLDGKAVGTVFMPSKVR